MPMWASCEERAKKQQKEGGTQEGPRIVKAASHKHPHNDLCDERPSGDSFFVLLRPIFLSLTMRTCIYFLRPPPLSVSLSLHIMHITRLSFSRRSFLVLCPCTSSLHHFSFSSPSPRSSFFHSRIVVSLQGIPRDIFFQRGSMREHAAPSWGACINIRLIMLDATITGPVGHRCAQVGFPARATVKFPCPNTMFNLYIAVAYVIGLVSREMRRITI